LESRHNEGARVLLTLPLVPDADMRAYDLDAERHSVGGERDVGYGMVPMVHEATSLSGCSSLRGDAAVVVGGGGREWVTVDNLDGGNSSNVKTNREMDGIRLAHHSNHGASSSIGGGSCSSCPGTEGNDDDATAAATQVGRADSGERRYGVNGEGGEAEKVEEDTKEAAACEQARIQTRMKERQILLKTLDDMLRETSDTETPCPSDSSGGHADHNVFSTRSDALSNENDTTSRMTSRVTLPPTPPRSSEGNFSKDEGLAMRPSSYFARRS